MTVALTKRAVDRESISRIGIEDTLNRTTCQHTSETQYHANVKVKPEEKIKSRFVSISVFSATVSHIAHLIIFNKHNCSMRSVGSSRNVTCIHASRQPSEHRTTYTEINGKWNDVIINCVHLSHHLATSSPRRRQNRHKIKPLQYYTHGLQLNGARRNPFPFDVCA